MTGPAQTPAANGDEAAVLRSLLEVAVNLSAQQSRRQLLDMILREARKLEHAEAGSLYVVDRGRLRFVVDQNDRLGDEQISQRLQTLDHETLSELNQLTEQVDADVGIPAAEAMTRRRFLQGALVGGQRA